MVFTSGKTIVGLVRRPPDRLAGRLERRSNLARRLIYESSTGRGGVGKEGSSSDSGHQLSIQSTAQAAVWLVWHSLQALGARSRPKRTELRGSGIELIQWVLVQLGMPVAKRPQPAHQL